MHQSAPFTTLLWLLLTVCTYAFGAAPERVVSINLCSDQLLVLLAEPEQIASVSHLASRPENSFVAEAAKQLPQNHARIEELLTLRPDLLLASPYSDPRLLQALRRFGLRVEVIPTANDLAAIQQNIQKMGQLLGQQARAQQMIDEMQQRLANLDISHDGEPPGAIFYQPRGYTAGLGTLQHSALLLAGWRNLAAEADIEGFQPIDLERLLLAQPKRIFTSPVSSEHASRAERLLQHPALRALRPEEPFAVVDFKHWICGGPMFVDAVEALHRERQL